MARRAVVPVALGALFSVAGVMLDLPAAAAVGVGLTVAAVHAATAEAVARRWSAAPPAAIDPEVVPSSPPPAGDGLLAQEEVNASFRSEGEYWTISYLGATFRLKDAKGLGYLRRLLAQPGQELHVVDLVAAGAPSDPRRPAEPGALHVGVDDAGAMLDSQAKAAYRQRLVELREEAEEAREWGDAEREERAEAEISALAQELSRAVGLHGRDRKAASASERARVNVTRAVKSAIDRIAEQDARLGHHLASTVHTGTFCCYRPDPAATPDWVL